MRLTLSITLIVLVVVAIWVLGVDSAAEAPTESPSNAIVDRLESEAAPRSATPIPKPIASPDKSVEIGEAREVLSDLPDGPTAGLVVVRFGTEAPIEGAAVGYTTDPLIWQSLSAEDRASMSRGEIGFYHRKGRVQRTDAKGECRVPVAERGLSVIIVFEDLYGRAYVRADQKEPQVVKLRADHQLMVKVIDHAGRPARGLTVLLERPVRSGRVSSWQLGSTDGDGEYLQRHTQAYAGDSTHCVMKVLARGFGVESQRVEVDLLATRHVDVALHMPRSGKITFELVTAAGKAFDLTGHAPANLNLGMHKTRPDRSASFRSQSTRRAFDQDARLEVDHVALDQFYSALVRGLRSDPLVGKGPTVDRPDIVVPIVIPASLVILRGRALDSRGAPLVKQSLALTCRYDRGRSSRSAETGESGEFLVPMPYVVAGKKLEISGRIQGRGLVRRTMWMTTRLESPWTTTAGINDLGDLTFKPAPLLLSGRLVVPESLGSIQQLYWQVERKRGRRWESLREITTQWLEDRRFEVRGAVAGAALVRLRFNQGKHLPLEPLEFKPGTKDIEITLASAGTVNATVLVDSVDMAEALSVKLEADSSNEKSKEDSRSRMMRESRDRFRLQPTGKGKLAARWDGLEPGVYHFRLECIGASEPLVSIPGIQVRGGEVVDGRLLNIDLRRRLRSIEITVNDHNGKSLDQEDALVILADATGANWRGHRLKEGKVRVAITDAATIRVLAEGYLLANVADVRADRVIQLVQPRAVRFRVKWPFPLPEGMTSRLRLTPRNVAGATRRTRLTVRGGSSGLDNRIHSDGMIDANGIAVIRPMVLGEQRVRIALSSNTRNYYLYSVTPRTIALAGTEVEEIVLEVGADGLRERLDRMKKR